MTKANSVQEAASDACGEAFEGARGVPGQVGEGGVAVRVCMLIWVSG